MAFRARHRGMLSLERVTRFAVVKIDSVDQSPTIGIVAGGTVLTQFAGVSVRVTGCAVAELHTAILHIVEVIRERAVRHQSVALQTGDGLMFAGELKLGRGVVKSSSRFPTGLCMTGGAVGAEITTVFVAMTGAARLAQSKKGTA